MACHLEQTHRIVYMKIRISPFVDSGFTYRETPPSRGWHVTLKQTHRIVYMKIRTSPFVDSGFTYRAARCKGTLDRKGLGMIVAKSLKKLNFGRFGAIILCDYWLIDMHFLLL